MQGNVQNMVNTQPIEKPEHRKDGSLWVHSMWDTIQGEGPYAGTPATFIRLGGCNLQCFLCDTEYTQGSELLTVDEVMGRLQLLPRRNLVVLTGGEPFRQALHPIKVALMQSRRRVQIETNGTLPPDVFGSYYGTVVCSPKTPKLAHEMWSHITDMKYVVQAGQVCPIDGLPLSSVGPQYGRPARPHQQWTGDIYVQPLDEQDEEKNKANTQAAVDSCLKHGYRLCLQVHKLVGLD